MFELDSIVQENIKSSGQIPMLLLHFKYHKIKQQAFDNNWIIVDGMELKDVSPAGQTPYEEKTIFALAPLISSLDEPSATFVLPSNFIFSNVAGAFNTIEADFNDGMGYRTITPNQPFSISSPFSGNLQTTVRAIKANDTLTSVALTENNYLTMSMMSTQAPSPDAVYPLIVSGKIHSFGVWRGCNNTCIRKPVIVIEGFDPTNKRELNSNTILDCAADKREDKNLYELVNAEGMADKMRNAGYDVVILNFFDGKASIQTKANVVKQLINILKDSLALCGSKEIFIVIGPSEAALVGRYALADMEGSGQDHNTRLYVSFDGPHQGANLPLSVQYFAGFLFDKIPALWLLPSKQMMEVLHCTPTKQMLAYHYSHFPFPSPDYSNFYTQLNNLNGGAGYPTKCRNIAIANGSGNSSNQGFNALDKLFAYNITTVIYNLYADGWAVPNGGSNQKIFSGIAIKPILSLQPFSVEIVKVGGTKPYDSAPGGTATFTKDFKDAFEENLGIFQSSDLFGRPKQDFIPTTSALDLKNTSGNLFYNIHSNITGRSGIGFKGVHYSASVSPFDAIYVSVANEDHVICGTTPSIAQFIADEIMSNDLYLQNETVTQARDFEAVETITAGRNVTNRKPQGDFVVANNSGTVNITAGQQIVLKPGTRISPTGTGSVHIFIDEARFENCQISCRMAATNDNSGGKSSALNASTKNKKEKEAVLTSNKEITEEKLKNGKFINYPNPCTDHTHIEYSIGETGNVELEIYNSKGQLVETLVKNQPHNKGVFISTLNTFEMAAGTYICILKINNQITERKKIIVVK